MEKEIQDKITLIDKKLETLEVGSVGYNTYLDIKGELLKRLEPEPAIRLHKDQDTVCESCQ